MNMSKKDKKKKQNKLKQSILSAFFYSPEELEEESLDLIDEGDPEYFDSDESRDSFLPEDEGYYPEETEDDSILLFDDDSVLE